MEKGRDFVSFRPCLFLSLSLLVFLYSSLSLSVIHSPSLPHFISNVITSHPSSFNLSHPHFFSTLHSLFDLPFQSSLFEQSKSELDPFFCLQDKEILLTEWNSIQKIQGTIGYIIQSLPLLSLVLNLFFFFPLPIKRRKR